MTEIQAVPLEPTRDLIPSRVGDMLQVAIEKGLGVEGIEKLVALHERIADRYAALEFADALARFQAKCPPIQRTAVAKESTTRSGGKFGGYLYAPLDEIARTINPLLAAEGLSYSWDTWFLEDGKRLKVTCILRHRAGHSIQSYFEAPTETVTQAMSPQQRVANAQSYGRRYSLIAVLGLSTCDPDNDGADVDLTTVTREQVEILEELIGKRPDGARARVLAYYQIGALEELRASLFEALKSDLESKIARDAK